MEMSKKTIALAALVVVGAFIVYKANQVEKVTEPYYPSLPEIMGEEPAPPAVVEVEVVREEEIIELPEIVITAPVPKVVEEPKEVRPKPDSPLVRLWKKAAANAVAQLEADFDITSYGNTVYLVVHETEMPCYAIMAAWLSEGSKLGHDPRIDNMFVSLFVVDAKGLEMCHIIYDPERDRFHD